MNIDKAAIWIEKNPGLAIVIGLTGTLAILWLLGFFSTPAAAGAGGDTGQTNMAAAYYAAEAQQAVVGGQIQMAHEAATSQTAQAATAANAAVAINAAQSLASVRINQQNADTSAILGKYGFDTATAGYDAATAQTSINAGASVAINQRNADLSASLGNYDLLATYSNNDAATAANAANNATAFQIAHDTNVTATMHDFLGSIVPQELALTGGDASYDLPGGPGSYAITGTHYVAPAPAAVPIVQQIVAPPAAEISHLMTGYEAAQSLGPLTNLWQGHNTPRMDIQQALIKGIPISSGSWAQAGLARIPGF